MDTCDHWHWTVQWTIFCLVSERGHSIRGRDTSKEENLITRPVGWRWPSYPHSCWRRLSYATQHEGGGCLAQLDAGERVLRLLDARVDGVASEWKWQEMAHTLWACARMGRMSGERGWRRRRGRGRDGERVLGVLDARVETVARRCDPQNMANLMWSYADATSIDSPPPGTQDVLSRQQGRHKLIGQRVEGKRRREGGGMERGRGRRGRTRAAIKKTHSLPTPINTR